MASENEPQSHPGGPPRRRWSLGVVLTALQVWTVWGIAVTNGFLGLAALETLRSGRRQLRAPTSRRLLVPTAIFAALLVLSVLFSLDLELSLPALNGLYSLLPLVVCPAFLVGRRTVRRVVGGLIAVGVLLSLYGFAQLALGIAAVGTEQRIRGPFSHYQTYAGILLVCNVLVLCRLLFAAPEHRDRAWRWLHAGALALITAALISNLTRGSWIAFCAAVLLVLAIRAPRRLPWLVPIALLVVLLAPSAVLERTRSIVDLEDESNYDRLCMMDAGLHMVRERPLLGIGPNLVEARYPIYRHLTAPKRQRPHLHNAFLQIAAERGLLSLAAMLLLFGASLRESLRGLRESGLAGADSDLFLGSIAALVAFAVAGLFEDNWSDTEVQRLALFLLAMPFCARARPYDVTRLPAADD